MNRLLGMVALTVGLAACQAGHAQVYQVYYAAPTAAYVQPAPVATAYYAPTTTYYAPTATYYAPARTAYYAPVTYYRPLLGGTITRWRYNYAPVAYAVPTTVAYYPAW